MPVIPAAREAEAGELLEPGKQSCSEMRSGHCTPAWVTDHVAKKKKKISQVWWCAPVVLATWEGEVKGLLELRR